MASYDDTLTSGGDSALLDDCVSNRSDDHINSSFFDAESGMSNTTTNNPLMKQLNRILGLKNFYKTVERSKSAEAELLKREERKIINSLQNDACQLVDNCLDDQHIVNDVGVLNESLSSENSVVSSNFELTESSPPLVVQNVNYDEIVIRKPEANGVQTNPTEDPIIKDSKNAAKHIVKRTFLKKGAGLSRYYGKKNQREEENVQSTQSQRLPTKTNEILTQSINTNSLEEDHLNEKPITYSTGVDSFPAEKILPDKIKINSTSGAGSSSTMKKYSNKTKPVHSSSAGCFSGEKVGSDKRKVDQSSGAVSVLKYKNCPGKKKMNLSSATGNFPAEKGHSSKMKVDNAGDFPTKRKDLNKKKMIHSSLTSALIEEKRPLTKKSTDFRINEFDGENGTCTASQYDENNQQKNKENLLYTKSQNRSMKTEGNVAGSTGADNFMLKKRRLTEKNVQFIINEPNEKIDPSDAPSPDSSYSILESDFDSDCDEDTELHLFEVMEAMTGRPNFTELSSLAKKFVNQEIGYEKGRKLDAEELEGWDNYIDTLSQANEDSSLQSDVYTTEISPLMNMSKNFVSDSAVIRQTNISPVLSPDVQHSDMEHHRGLLPYKQSEPNLIRSEPDNEMEKSNFLNAIGRLSKLNSELIETKDLLQHQNLILMSDNKLLATENKQLQEEKRQILEEKEKLRVEKEKLRMEKERLVCDKKQFMDEKKELRLEKEKLRIEKERLVDDNEQLTDEKQSLIDEKAHSIFIRDELIAEKKQLIEENSELIKNVQELTNEKNKLFASAQDLLSQKNQYYKQCVELKARNSISGTKLANGNIELRLENGTTKYICRTGRDYKFVYRNGDIKEMDLDGTIKYYYSETKMWHITHPDGVITVQFSDGQTETQNLDGSKQIVYPNKVIREIKPNGEEQYVYPDKTTCVTDGQGVKCYSFPNGQKEYHYPNFIKRIFPDNTVKTLYPDGSTETKYINGRIRVKNKDGVVVRDSGEPLRPDFLREIDEYMRHALPERVNSPADSDQSEAS